MEVFVLSIVLEERIYCFREFSLWENGLKEINSEFDPWEQGIDLWQEEVVASVEDVSVNNIRHVFLLLNHHQESKWCLWKHSSSHYFIQYIRYMFRGIYSICSTFHSFFSAELLEKDSCVLQERVSMSTHANSARTFNHFTCSCSPLKSSLAHHQWYDMQTEKGKEVRINKYSK